MIKLSKRQEKITAKVELGKTYPIQEAIRILKECATAKFKESVDVALKLGLDAKKSDQTVRGAVVLPHGTGQKIRVAVFAQGDNVAIAKAAGADIVGLDDLAESIKAGNFDFDVVIAAPDTMRVVGQLGQVLGPRGLMPNPKVGTVAADVAGAVKNAKSGQVRFRTDKNGIVHCIAGKAEFDENAIRKNIETLLAEVKRLKPTGAKGTYLKKMVISSTMGPGINVDLSSIAVSTAG